MIDKYVLIEDIVNDLKKLSPSIVERYKAAANLSEDMDDVEVVSLAFGDLSPTNKIISSLYIEWIENMGYETPTEYAYHMMLNTIRSAAKICDNCAQCREYPGMEGRRCIVMDFLEPVLYDKGCSAYI